MYLTQARASNRSSSSVHGFPEGTTGVTLELGCAGFFCRLEGEAMDSGVAGGSGAGTRFRRIEEMHARSLPPSVMALGRTSR